MRCLVVYPAKNKFPFRMDKNLMVQLVYSAEFVEYTRHFD